LTTQNSDEINFERPFILGQWLITPALNTVSLINEDIATYVTHDCVPQDVIRKLTPKVMALCVYLAKSNGHPISQSDIAAIVWPDRIISDSSIYQAIAQLRKVFNHPKVNKDHIELVSGKGYRLLVKVTQCSGKGTYEQNSKVAENLNVAGHSSVSFVTKPLFRFFIIALLILFFSVFSSVWYYLWLPEKVENEEYIIAVLPTQNLTQPSIESLDSFNQLLLSDLVSLPKVKFIYLRKNVDSVSANSRLLTTVQQHKNALLVSAQLVSQDNGEVLWAKSFEEKQSDLLTLKNTVVAALVDHLWPQSAQYNNQIDISQDAYFETYALARYLWDKREVQPLKQAQQLFQQILVKSPNHLGALIGLCHTHLYLSVYGRLPVAQAHQNCQPLIEQALAINSTHGEVIATQALLLMDQGKTNEAGRLFNKAAKLAPNYAMGHHWRANFLRQTGQFQQALQADKNAFSLDPLSPIIIRGLAYSYLNMRQLKEAKKYYQRALLIEPNYSHRALEELDFLSLNQVRAKAFIQWINTDPSNITNLQVYKLTQVLVWLGLGNIDKAESLINSINEKEVNPSFLLYSQSALASAKGDLGLALQKLTRRLELAPEIPRYAMPYILALKHRGLANEALSQFRYYFADIAFDVEITDENVAQYIFLGGLLHESERFKEKDQIVAKLNDYIAQDSHHLSDLDKIYWYELVEQRKKLKPHIQRLLNNGWLPDYNDNIFSENDIKALYLNNGGSVNQWQKLLQSNRAIE
jgi:DNA-binding winged helix-turn-helix (wHTH) protein/thioredoxin-like negative regulator of GroEL